MHDAFPVIRRRTRASSPGPFDVTPRDRDPARMHDTRTGAPDLIEDDFDPDDFGPGDTGDPGSSFSIGGLHWLAWVFILFALGDLAWYVATATFSATPSLADFVVYSLQIIPAVSTVLFPAALLARHPDATTRAPVLLLGTILVALVQALVVLGDPLQSVFDAVTPPTPDLPNFVALAAAYNGFTLLLAACGLALIARGLSLARQYEDAPGKAIGLLVPVATIFATVVGILAASKLTLPDPMPSVYLVYLAANIILAILRVAAWAYLATSALTGWRAGEEPRVGWRLAAVAGLVVIFALVLVNLPGVFDLQDQTLVQLYGWIIVIAYSGGHLLLLASFATGLPSLDEPEDDGDEDDEDDDDDEDDEDEVPADRRG
ncbi:MAG: hypothetical protein QOE66_1367 [Chloroflexota bacterium]|nr:hypothetical protein [Chloroflexota bacterium]